MPYVEANLDIWIQLGEESQEDNDVVLETVKLLRTKMINLRFDNERMRQEQENILKSLFNR